MKGSKNVLLQDLTPCLHSIYLSSGSNPTRLGYAGVVQNDEKENISDQVGDCQVQRGETAKFLQSFHFLSPFFIKNLTVKQLLLLKISVLNSPLY